MARQLINDAYIPEEFGGYDTQGVNQAHRVLDGGDFPRKTITP